jgi:nicotinamide riboside transporter PnuC
MKRLDCHDWIGLVGTVLAVAGVVLNNYRLALCFVLFLGSNTLALLVHRRDKRPTMVLRDLIFLALAIQGLYLWTR